VTEPKMKYVYEVDTMRLDGYAGIVAVGSETNCDTSDIGLCVSAAIAIRSLPEMEQWDGRGEYWTAPLPPDMKIVVVRPGNNPFRSGYVVSEVQLPWLTEKSDDK